MYQCAFVFRYISTFLPNAHTYTMKSRHTHSIQFLRCKADRGCKISKMQACRPTIKSESLIILIDFKQLLAHCVRKSQIQGEVIFRA